MASLPLDPKIAGNVLGGACVPSQVDFLLESLVGRILLAQLVDPGSGGTWYMQLYCLRRHPAPISRSSSSEHDWRRTRAGTCSQQPGQVAVPLPQTSAEREGPRHPPLWLQPRARLRWTERSQWLFLALAVALPVALGGFCAGPALADALHGALQPTAVHTNPAPPCRPLLPPPFFSIPAKSLCFAPFCASDPARGERPSLCRRELRSYVSNCRVATAALASRASFHGASLRFVS